MSILWTFKQKGTPLSGVCLPENGNRQSPARHDITIQTYAGMCRNYKRFDSVAGLTAGKISFPENHSCHGALMVGFPK
ncbi:MAG: hypothetical protein U5K27_14430 [Desulfotignum sp.]|nr:hypothetical protein [Desulfotignum sp.]